MAEFIVVFCAHSDDQILGAGGTLAYYANKGFEVYTFIFSFGELSHPWLKERFTAEIRVKESEDADRVIGGKGVVFFGLKEGKFKAEMKEKGILEKVKNVIKDKKPFRIFTHSPDDPMPDHKAVFNTVVNAAREVNYNEGIFCFDIWNPISVTQHSRAQLYVNIAETFELKAKAMSYFKSQWIAIGILRWLVYFRAVFSGLNSGFRLAERFYKVR